MTLLSLQMISVPEKGSLPPSGPERRRYLSTIRRKIIFLGTRLDSLESLLSELTSKKPIIEEELHCQQDMLVNLRSKANQIASTLNMSNLGNREGLLGPNQKVASEINRTAGLDNYGIVGLQR